MSKILDATCQANVVTSEGIVIPGVTVLSKGVASSSGLLILDEEKATYLTSNATDIESTLTKIASILDSVKAGLEKIALTFTSIGSGMTGPTTAPPGTLATDVALINARATELGVLKTEINTLKGNLK